MIKEYKSVSPSATPVRKQQQAVGTEEELGVINGLEKVECIAKYLPCSCLGKDCCTYSM
jgi:hypothetical protein